MSLLSAVLPVGTHVLRHCFNNRREITMETPTHRKHHVPDSSPKQQKIRDSTKKRHIHKDKSAASIDDDIYEPKKHVPSLFERFIDFDLKLSVLFFLCASPDSKWGILRPAIKVIEIFGDGLVWMLVPVAFLVVTEEKWLIEFNVNILAATAFDLCVLFIMKMAAKRPRPIVNKGDMLIVVAVDNYSFPSGHCTRAGMMVYIFLKYFNLSGIYNLIGCTWMVVMAISRLLLGRHYISDVICGTVVGIIEGWIVIAVWITVDNLESIMGLFFKN